MKRVTVITTLDHNVGDDFVRIGACHILRSRLSGSRIGWTFLHKHSPVSARPRLAWCRNIPYETKISPATDALMPLSRPNDPILDCDIFVQSGAPVYWCIRGNADCAGNEWYGSFIKRRYSRVKDRAPSINLASGSCLS